MCGIALCSGLGALGIALATGSAMPGIWQIVAALLLGFVAYGLSILFYVRAQRDLGAARTSAYYALSPFIGVALSFLMDGAAPAPLFFAALAAMAAGAYLAARE